MQDCGVNTATQEQKARLRSRGICVIIPTYNNAGTIVDVVSRALAQCHDVIVVCDGCTDNTLQLLRAMPTPPVIVELPQNSGKGSALKKGFEHALKAGFAYAITLDGDGQHFPEDIPVFLEANIKNPGALIVGQRKNLDSMQRSKGSRFANSFSNFWFAVQTGHYLKDTQTGYRLYPLKKLYGLSFLTSRYEAELELMVFASWHGVKLVSEPVNVFYPAPEERVSHFKPAKDFTRISVLNTVLCFLAVVYALPLFVLRLLCTALRTLYTIVLFFSFTGLFFIPLVHIYFGIGKVTEEKKYRFHKLICWAGRFATSLHGVPGCKYSRQYNSEEDFGKPAVIICNHQSHLDLPTMLSYNPKIIILTAKWVWNYPLYRSIIRNAEFLPASAGLDRIMPQLRNLVKRGYNIAIYPEGTRSSDLRIGRFHQGAFYLARELGLDIIPTFIYGTGRALPKHGRYLRRWHIHSEIDRRISCDELMEMGPGIKEQASAMRNYYIKRYAQIADRMDRNV